jgi:hypothetical protein
VLGAFGGSIPVMTIREEKYCDASD